MMRAIEQLLVDVFKAHGASDAPRLAKLAADSFDLDQRDAKIYELRKTLSEEAIADRFGLSVRHVSRINKAQLMLRRN